MRAADIAEELGASDDEFDVLRELSRGVELLPASEEERREAMRVSWEAGHDMEPEFDEDGFGHVEYVFNLPPDQALEQITRDRRALEQIAASAAPEQVAAMPALSPTVQARRHVEGSGKRTGRRPSPQSSSRGSPERPPRSADDDDPHPVGRSQRGASL